MDIFKPEYKAWEADLRYIYFLERAFWWRNQMHLDPIRGLFLGVKTLKIIFWSYEVIDLWWLGGSMTSFHVILVQNERLIPSQRLKLS